MNRELKESIAKAIRGIELGYPLFKPNVETIAFWSSCLMKINFKPEDIISGAEKLMFSGVEAFKIDIGRLTQHCKDAMSERVKGEHRKFRALEDKSKNNMFNGQGKSNYTKEMIEATKKLNLGSKDFFDKPDLEKLEVFKKKVIEINKKHGKSIPEDDTK